MEHPNLGHDSFLATGPMDLDPGSGSRSRIQIRISGSRSRIRIPDPDPDPDPAHTGPRAQARAPGPRPGPPPGGRAAAGRPGRVQLVTLQPCSASRGETPGKGGKEATSGVQTWECAST